MYVKLYMYTHTHRVVLYAFIVIFISDLPASDGLIF